MRPQSALVHGLLSASILASTAGCASRSSPSNAGPATGTGPRSPYLTGPRPARPDDAHASARPQRADTVPATPAPVRTLALFGETGAASPASMHDGSENLRRVSFATEGADTDPAVSPDGGTIYFSSTAHHPNPDIYAKAAAGRSVTQLTSDPGSDIMPAVSPDGSRIAFASDRAGSWDLYVMNAAGGQPVQITSDATHELRPTWSPDGRSIAYCKLGEVSGRWEIWVTDADEAGAQRFLTLGLFPDWHPTGNTILFQRSRDRGGRLFSVWTLEYVKGEATRLTEIASSPDAALINPRWSRDGEYVAFASVPAGAPPATPASPANDPASRSAADDPPTNADIWIMNVRGGGMANLTNGRFVNLMPAWGPAGSIYFVSNRGGNDTIWSVRTEAAMLAAGAGNAAAPHAQAIPTHLSSTPASLAVEDAPDTGANPAPAQPEPQPQPDLANVPIDDRER